MTTITTETRTNAINSLIANWNSLVADESMTALELAESLTEQTAHYPDMSADELTEDLCRATFGHGLDEGDEEEQDIEADIWTSIVDDAAAEWLRQNPELAEEALENVR